MARHLEPAERRVHHSLLVKYQISLAMELRWRALPAGSAMIGQWLLFEGFIYRKSFFKLSVSNKPQTSNKPPLFRRRNLLSLPPASLLSHPPLPLPQSLYGRTLTSQPNFFGLIDYQEGVTNSPLGWFEVSGHRDVTTWKAPEFAESSKMALATWC